MDEEIIAAVRRKRQAEGLSLRALAGLVNVSFSSLARLERGEGLPDANTRVRLIEWLGEHAREIGLGFDRIAFVHFRAGKNVSSGTVRHLLRAADCLKDSRREIVKPPAAPVLEDEQERHVRLSKEELEQLADELRQELGFSPEEAFDPMTINVEGVEVSKVTSTKCLDVDTRKVLTKSACSEWSAMSVPLDASLERWTVLLNDCHTIPRQRVTLLEEYWHIMLGHRLTRVAKIADAYGRSYDKDEEHDAYYLASASLLPRVPILKSVREGKTSAQIAQIFGTSAELVDYRLKRLGLWHMHVKKRVTKIS